MAANDLPVYKGSKAISQTLSYKGLDEQIQKLAQFDAIFMTEMSAAMEQAVGIASDQAKKNAPKLTGKLEASIYGKMLSTFKGSSVRGAIGTELGLKAFAQEVGRFYGNAGAGTTHFWKGKFYLYFGARDKKAAIDAEYAKANQRIINKLVVMA
jgi:hypothetical protein